MFIEKLATFDYSEAAKRVLFFAHYESKSFGSDVVGTEHLLLGLLRLAPFKPSFELFVSKFGLAVEEVRLVLESGLTIVDSNSPVFEVPLSSDSKEALTKAHEYRTSVDHKLLSPPHILVGLLQQRDTWVAGFLTGRGLTVELIQRDLLDSDEGDWT